jgi:prepilin-type N-terminal cleavage/methylation domain-containing protein
LNDERRSDPGAPGRRRRTGRAVGRAAPAVSGLVAVRLSGWTEGSTVSSAEPLVEVSPSKPSWSRNRRENRSSTIDKQQSPPLPHSRFVIRHSARGMTMIEMLVVVVILGILVSIVTVASSALIGQSKTTNTKAVLQLVSDAIQEFKRERPPIINAKKTLPTGQIVSSYLKRYGPYPPDELDVFLTGNANPVSPTSLAPGKALINPAPSGPMKFYGDADSDPAQEHRDLAAMILAIETTTEKAAAILEKIDDRHRAAGPLDGSGQPLRFLDRAPAGWDVNDHQIRYVVDDWGAPLGYMTQRDWQKTPAPPNQNVQSTNHDRWNEVSTELVRAAGGEPLVFSYGPDGAEQLKKDAMDSPTAGAASLAGDLSGDNSLKADHPYNADNIYLQDGLAEKLAKGLRS